MIGVNNKNVADNNDLNKFHHRIYHLMEMHLEQVIPHPQVLSENTKIIKMDGLEQCAGLLALIIEMKAMTGRMIH